MEVASGDEENLQLRVATRRNSTAEGHVPSPSIHHPPPDDITFSSCNFRCYQTDEHIALFCPTLWNVEEKLLVHESAVLQPFCVESMSDDIRRMANTCVLSTPRRQAVQSATVHSGELMVQSQPPILSLSSAKVIVLIQSKTVVPNSAP